MTNLASASDTKFDSNNQLKYLSYQNCQENFLNCLLKKAYKTPGLTIGLCPYLSDQRPSLLP